MTWDEGRSKAEAERLALAACTACGYAPDAVSPSDEDSGDRVRPGALLVCIGCGALSIVDGSEAVGLYLRDLTADEHRRALADPRVVQVLEARAVVARRAGPDWPGSVL